MQVANGDIRQAREAIAELAREPWPVKTAYWLAKLAKKLNAENALIEQVRIGLVRKHGEQNEQGQIAVTPGSEGWEAFVKEFNDLLAQEVDIPLEKVTLPDLDGIRITPQVLLGLEAFVDVENA